MTQEEFKSLILPSKEKLFRIAAMLLRDQQEAEDALQDVILKLWNMRKKLLEYNSVEALAVTMIKNHCTDILRSYRSRKRNDAEIGDLPLKAETSDPVRQSELNDDMRTLHRIVKQLPDQQRMVLQLRDIEQFSYDEMEKITGLTRNNIRVSLSRARKKVRKEYLKHRNYGHRKN